jgi:nucleoside-diphosphate-sugar epimerase
MFRTLVEKSVDGVEHTVPPGVMEWLYSKDAARGVVLALQAEGVKSRVFNLGVGRPYDNQELIGIFKQVVPGAKLGIDESATTSQTSSVFLDITRAQTELGFDAEYDIPAAVTDFVGWYRRLKAR